jgi:hypothetical protein
MFETAAHKKFGLAYSVGAENIVKSFSVVFYSVVSFRLQKDVLACEGGLCARLRQILLSQLSLLRGYKGQLAELKHIYLYSNRKLRTSLPGFQLIIYV